MKKTINVVGAIIENENREILCALRSKNMSLANFWEFPGGKIEKGETLAEAIVREIYEELDCTIETLLTCLMILLMNMLKIIVNLVTVKCKLIEGPPKANEHAKLIWLPIDYLESLNWAPADCPTVKKLLSTI